MTATRSLLIGALCALTTACSPELALAPYETSTAHSIVLNEPSYLLRLAKIRQELQQIISLQLLTDAELEWLTAPLDRAADAFAADNTDLAIRQLHTFIDRAAKLESEGRLSAFWLEVLTARALDAMVLPPVPSELLLARFALLSDLSQGDAGAASALQAIALNAQRAVAAGRIEAAIRDLHAFGDRVYTLEASGTLSFDQARALKIALNETFMLLEEFYRAQR